MHTALLGPRTVDDHRRASWAKTLGHTFLQVNPEIRKEKWTEDEDNKLIELVNTHGSCWAEIARGMAVGLACVDFEQSPFIVLCLPSSIAESTLQPAARSLIRVRTPLLLAHRGHEPD